MTERRGRWRAWGSCSWGRVRWPARLRAARPPRPTTRLAAAGVAAWAPVGTAGIGRIVRDRGASRRDPPGRPTPAPVVRAYAPLREPSFLQAFDAAAISRHGLLGAATAAATVVVMVGIAVLTFRAADRLFPADAAPALIGEEKLLLYRDAPAPLPAARVKRGPDRRELIPPARTPELPPSPANEAPTAYDQGAGEPAGDAPPGASRPGTALEAPGRGVSRP